MVVVCGLWFIVWIVDCSVCNVQCAWCFVLYACAWCSVLCEISFMLLALLCHALKSEVKVVSGGGLLHFEQTALKLFYFLTLFINVLLFVGGD